MKLNFSAVKTVLAFVSLLLLYKLSSAQYQPNWESLDQRPVPQWFKDSKFDIFGFLNKLE